MRTDFALGPSHVSAGERRWLWSLLLYAALMALLPVLFAETVRSMLVTWWMTTAFNHCAFVPLASIVMGWRQRHRLARQAPRPDLWGLPLLMLALAGWLAGRAADLMLLQQLALVAVIIALFVAVFGREIARQLAFPLAFLFLMVPFGEGLIPPLQSFTAEFSVRLLRLLDVPVFHQGILIMTPSGLFEVAEACAGLRFLIANVVIALLFAHLAFRRAWKWVAFLSLAVIVPIVANGLRAAGIIYIAYLTDNRFAVGVDHIVYGWGFFAVVMLVLLVVGNCFADPPARADEPLPAARRRGARPATVLAAALAMLVAFPAYATLVMRGPAAVPHLAEPPGPAFAGWEARPLEGWLPRLGGTDLTIGRTYLADGERVDLAIGYYAFQRPGSELVQGANRLAGEGWRRSAAGRQDLEIEGLPGRVAFERLIGLDQERHRLVLAWYWLDGRFTGGPVQALAIHMGQRLLGREAPAAIIAVSAPYLHDPAEAMAVITRFLGQLPSLEPYLEAIGPAALPRG